MKQILKNQSGVAIIVIILVIVIAVVAGCATFLGVRMAITGEPFLQPFEDLGLISLDDDDDEEEDKKTSKSKDDEKNKDDTDEENDRNKAKDNSSDKKSGTSSVVNSRLSEEAKKSDTVHYYGSMVMSDNPEYQTGEYAELYSLLKLEVDVYARDNKAVEIVFSIKMKDFLKGAYDLYKDEFVELGYTTYEKFEEEMLPVFESNFDLGFESAVNNADISKYLKKYQDGGDIQLYVTQEGFSSLYDTYGIKEGENDINTIIDALEDSMGITINKI